jgi:hypothetical protein
MEYTKEDIDRMLSSKSYKFAKTMPNDPHAYAMFYQFDNRPQFEKVVQFMRDNGVKEHWKYGKYYIYYYLDGYKYWTMGFDLPTTKLINRAEVIDENYSMLDDKYKVDKFSDE